MVDPAEKYKHFLSLFSFYSAIIVASIGALVLAGWQFNIEHFKSIVPGLTAMNPVTAFNFILCAVCLYFFYKKISLEKNFFSAKVLVIPSVIIFYIGANRLLAYLFDIPTDIDLWLYTSKVDDDHTSLHNRMSPNASFMFILVSISIMILILKKGKFSGFVQVAFLICSFISLFAIFGYISSYSSALYQFEAYVPMSLHASIAFFILSFGFIALHSEKGFFSVMTSEYLGGKIFRRLILFSVAIPFLLGWFRVVTTEHNLLHPELAFSIIIVLLIIILSIIIWATSRHIDAIDIGRRKAEEEMKKAVFLAENAKNAQQRFLANMSHEIRTPLNAIMGFSDILQKQNINSELQKEYINHISTSGNMLLKLIGDILDINKIEAGKLHINNESFHLEEVISTALYPYKFRANEKGLDFSLHFDEFLPSYVIGDSDRIKQILINLIGNAMKFTESGGISVSISNAGINNLNEARILFLVSDTGMGVPEEKQKEIFESFTQADNSISRKFGGSGLGLSIVKQLVEAMGGEIHVTSPVPNGTESLPGSTFWFTLMLKINDEAKDHVKEIKSLKISKFDREVQVLIAEDNELNQKLAAVILTNIGCKPIFAMNGKEALELFRKENKFDIILMDVNMPVMNGYEATQIIREEFQSNIPIIGLTANVYMEDIELCLKAGMNGHLGKPYNELQIFNMIDKWCFNSMHSVETSVEQKFTDLEFIRGLIKSDKRVLKEMIISFISQKEDFLSRIAPALEDKNWNEIEFMAHTLKSSLRIFGLEKIIPQIITLESRTHELEQLDTIPALIEEIREALNHSVHELEHELMKL